MLSMLPEIRKVFTVFSYYIGSGIGIFNLNEMSEARSDLESWIRDIVWDKGNVFVNPKDWNMIDQNDFSCFLSCFSEFNCFQLK